MPKKVFSTFRNSKIVLSMSVSLQGPGRDPGPGHVQEGCAEADQALDDVDQVERQVHQVEGVRQKHEEEHAEDGPGDLALPAGEADAGRETSNSCCLLLKERSRC